ncbi:16410_t:CDS:2 [Entrophospora sp. SA101]|nr:16410_t:CDS:2 [Entrophospora sp. SA101]CAJ0823922.1 2443_t:CDS:2 [Entrophospora sp. SA101]
MCFAYSNSSSNDKEMRYWLTQCGHVICNSCVNKHGNNNVSSDNKQNGICNETKVNINYGSAATIDNNPRVVNKVLSNKFLEILGEYGKSSRSNTINCLFCNKKCAIVECNDNLDHQLSSFFQPFHEMLDGISDVYRFQQTNTKSLINHLKDKVTQQENMLYKVNNDYRELKSQLISLTNENNRLKEQLKAFQRENTFMNNPNASNTEN